MSSEPLLAAIEPIVVHLAQADLSDPAAVRRDLEEAFPFAGQAVQAVREAAVAGAAAGWLLPKTNGSLRYGRLAKDLRGFSIDAVEMSTPGPRHRHPRGEVDLCFARAGSPRFDGEPEGWVVYGPDSVHVPTVAGGTMLILYFLPGGAIEFLAS